MLNFPNSPTNGQLYTGPNGVQYTWSAPYGSWLVSISPYVEPANLSEAATGSTNLKYSSPQTSVPKNASGMTGAALLPGSGDSGRPGTPAVGMFRYNNESSPANLEFYDGSDWRTVSLL